jgi:biotin transport system substrate-specific component
MSTVAATVKGWAFQEVVVDGRARLGIGMMAFVLATSFGAYVAVPLPWTPVPVTLQTLFVLLSGAMLGARGGAAAMAAYLALGASGAPVFSMGGAGLPWLLGPTGGYLLAMPAAAYLVGATVGRGGSWLRLVAGLSLGTVTIYVGGAAQLFLVGGAVEGLFALAVLPFLAGDATKIVAASLLARAARSKSLGR